MNLTSYAIAFMIAVIVIGVSGLVLTEVRTQIGVQDSTTGYGYNATTEGLEGIETLGNWLPIVVILQGAFSGLKVLLQTYNIMIALITDFSEVLGIPEEFVNLFYGIIVTLVLIAVVAALLKWHI